MSYVAIVGSVVSIGVGAYQASQTKDAASQVGQKPKAALYEPVDYGKMQLNTVRDDYNNLDWIRGLNDKVNNVVSTQDMKRIMKFVPNFKSIMQTEANNANDLTRGQLPYDDVLDIASNRSGLANALGTPGAAGPATLKDLGVSRLSAMDSGANLLRNMVGIAEQVSPIARYSRPQDYLLTPSQTIPWEIEQRQLEQQSQQSANNIAAGASPAALAGAAAQASGATNPYSSIGPALGSIGGALRSNSSSSSSGGLMDSGFYSSPGAAYSGYASPGYSPVILSNPHGSGYYSPYSVPAS